jgi:hypothetical protein
LAKSSRAPIQQDAGECKGLRMYRRRCQQSYRHD